MRKVVQRCILAIACLAPLVSAQEVFAINPTEGFTWSTNSQSLQNNGSTAFYQGIWNTAASNWRNNTNFYLGNAITNANYTAGDTYDSTVSWDGTTYLAATYGIITSSSSYANRYYTAQNKYTTAICNGIATHELGHSIGLAHTAIGVISVMFPYTFNSDGTEARPSNSPSSSDIATVNYLYPNLGASVQPTSYTGSTVVMDPSWAVKYSNANDLAKHADLVVEGKIISEKGTKFSEKGQYFTYKSYSDIKIDNVLKGDASLKGASISVSQMGGTDGEVTVTSLNTTLLKQNDNVLLLLRKVGANVYAPINEDESVYELNASGLYKHLSDQKEYSQDEIVPQVRG